MKLLTRAVLNQKEKVSALSRGGKSSRFLMFIFIFLFANDAAQGDAARYESSFEKQTWENNNNRNKTSLNGWKILSDAFSSKVSTRWCV